MSNPFAIAAVTLTLKRLIWLAVQPNPVTTLPLDRAAGEGSSPRVNLFLFQTTPNAAYRNMDVPPPGNGRLNSSPLLALDLHYLLTPFGDDDVESDHRLLGQAMRALHDYPYLSPEFIEETTTSLDGQNEFDLHRQLEPVRLTHQPMTLEDMSKLWTLFHQTQYRLSAVYVGSVVLIESVRRKPVPLPVLSRGERNEGVILDLFDPPRLTGIEYRDGRERIPPFPSAQSGDTVTIFGENISSRHRLVLSAFQDNSMRRIAAYEFEILQPSSLAVAMLTPNNNWISGQLSLALEYQTPQGETKLSRPLPIRIAPELVLSANEVSTLTVEENGRSKLIVHLVHPPRTGSEVFLVLLPLGEGEAPPFLRAEKYSEYAGPTSLVFDTADVAAGRYRIRVRVDGVDSLFMERTGNAFRFDPRQEVSL